MPATVLCIGDPHIQVANIPEIDLLILGIVNLAIKTQPNYDGDFTNLKDLIQNGEVTEDFYIDKNDLDKWMYLKGPKKEMRTNAQGFEYNYSEGGMIFPDP